MSGINKLKAEIISSRSGFILRNYLNILFVHNDYLYILLLIV